MSELKEMKIAVVGAGGVGGYMAAMLAKTFPHVTVVARGERGASIREKGMVLHGDLDGEIVSHPEAVVESAELLEPQDVIFVCVKNYSLEEACAQMKGAVKADTIVIPIMNGVDPGDRTREYLGKGIVMDSVIYIVSFANEDYSITQQGNFTDLRFGVSEELECEDFSIEEIQEKVAEMADLLELAGIDYKVSGDIESDIWKKYILNCAYNVETAYYNLPIGALRSDSRKAKEFEQLVYEAYEVAKKKDIHVKAKHADDIIMRFYNLYAEDATSSLQRDIAAGRTAEIETFPGYLVREAKRLGIPVPVSERMYEEMKAKM